MRITGAELLQRPTDLIDEVGIPGLEVYAITESLESPMYHRRDISGVSIVKDGGGWHLQALYYPEEGEEVAISVAQPEASDILQQLLDLT